MLLGTVTFRFLEQTNGTWTMLSHYMYILFF